MDDVLLQFVMGKHIVAYNYTMCHISFAPIGLPYVNMFAKCHNEHQSKCSSMGQLVGSGISIYTMSHSNAMSNLSYPQ